MDEYKRDGGREKKISHVVRGIYKDAKEHIEALLLCPIYSN